MVINTPMMRTKRRKRKNTLRVIVVNHDQVSDSQERLDRVYRILLSSFEEMKK